MTFRLISVLLMFVGLVDQCECYDRPNNLEDEIKVPFVVHLNVSKLNHELAKYISSDIQTSMKSSMESELKRLVDGKAAALTTMLMTKMDTLKNEMMKAVNISISSELQNINLVNLAAGMLASQSSTYDVFDALKVTNGNLLDFSCTRYSKPENKPWIRIDLGHYYKVYKIKIFNRQSCCGERLHDLDIKVENTLGNMYLCGHFVGPGSNGEIIDIECSTHPMARFVVIQIVKGEANILSVSEIFVLGIK